MGLRGGAEIAAAVRVVGLLQSDPPISRASRRAAATGRDGTCRRGARGRPPHGGPCGDMLRRAGMGCLVHPVIITGGEAVDGVEWRVSVGAPVGVIDGVAGVGAGGSAGAGGAVQRGVDVEEGDVGVEVEGSGE